MTRSSDRLEHSVPRGRAAGATLEEEQDPRGEMKHHLAAAYVLQRKHNLLSSTAETYLRRALNNAALRLVPISTYPNESGDETGTVSVVAVNYKGQATAIRQEVG